jgi:hypothetical protein
MGPAVALALETLRPDLPLLVLTSCALVGTIYTSLRFPSLIGELFDVVRAGTAQPPAAYEAALRALFIHLAASAAGNCLVTALLAPVAAARFAARLRERLMQASGGRRAASSSLFLCAWGGCWCGAPYPGPCVGRRAGLA